MDHYKNNIDYKIIIIPLIIIMCISIGVIFYPEFSVILNNIRNFLTDDIGVYFIIFGAVSIITLIILGLSKYGKVVLGSTNTPKYNTFSWGAMIFTSTMAADILFYSLHEWSYYLSINPIVMHEMNLAEQITWASTYPLFHWGAIPWSFYILPAIAYAYMFHIKKKSRQKLSEACRPVLGDKCVNGFIGKLIDQFSVIGLLLAVASTFAAATPLMSELFSNIINVNNSNILTIIILLCVAILYTFAVISGMKGISNLANVCTTLFILSVTYVLLFSGNSRFIIESGFSGLGNMIQNFVVMITATDPGRLSEGFIQNWTIFYWTYWIAWSVATPFFIAKISEGRTIRNVAFGGLGCGLLGTFMSFIVFGNAGLAEQVSGRIDVIEKIVSGATSSEVIIEIINNMKFPIIGMILILITMILLYSSTLDALVNVVSSYSYRELSVNEEPGKINKIYWSILFIVLPTSLIYNNSALSQIQTMSIIAAFPLSIIIIIIVIGLFKQLRMDYK